jgi:hypothetical protein
MKFRLIPTKPIWIFALSLLVSIVWMQSFWLSLPSDEHITYPTFTNHLAITSLFASFGLLILSLVLLARKRQWILFTLIIIAYLPLELLLAFSVYAVNGNNYLPFYSSFSGLTHLKERRTQDHVYNVAYYGYLATDWYVLYQCDSLGIQCDLLHESQVEEDDRGRPQLDNFDLRYDPSSHEISLLVGTTSVYSHLVPTSR